MSFAIGFVRFRVWQVKGDTIPKPVGLGSRGPREARSNRCVFIEYSMPVQGLFNAAYGALCSGQEHFKAGRQWMIR
jgi:hypothetical protein